MNLIDLLQKPTITVDECSRILNLSRNATYAAVHSGEIPSVRMGRRLLVLTGPLRKMLQMDGDKS